METKKMWILDPGVCPICSKPNGCMMAAGRAEEGCWCTEAVIPGELLALVPEEAKGKACICRDCVAAWHRDRGQFLKNIGQNPGSAIQLK